MVVFKRIKLNDYVDSAGNNIASSSLKNDIKSNSEATELAQEEIKSLKSQLQKQKRTASEVESRYH